MHHSPGPQRQEVRRRWRAVLWISDQKPRVTMSTISSKWKNQDRIHYESVSLELITCQLLVGAFLPEGTVSSEWKAQPGVNTLAKEVDSAIKLSVSGVKSRSCFFISAIGCSSKTTQVATSSATQVEVTVTRRVQELRYCLLRNACSFPLDYNNWLLTSGWI